MPIIGLEFHRVPGSEKYFIIATTPNRLYQFIGYVTNSEERPLFQQVFNNYLNVPGELQLTVLLCCKSLVHALIILFLCAISNIDGVFIMRFQFFNSCHEELNHRERTGKP